MISSYYDLREKEVINLVNGEKLGRICDLDIDLDRAKICALILPGKCRFFGLFGREEDIVIDWGDISLIGDDVILVNRCTVPPKDNKRR